MKIQAFCVLAIFLAGSPVLAQELDTTQLEQSADYERNRTLVRSTLRHKQAYDARRTGVTPRQARACASKERFRAQHGADDPRVRLLFQKCRAVGL
jgi:hypothetical protein